MAEHVGIIGGGQLGMLLCLAARGLNLRTTVLTPSPEDPAASVADHQIFADLDDIEAAAQLVRAVDVITFEIETVAPEVLSYLAQADQLGQTRVAPGPQVLLMVQNKALQKQWLWRNEFPTAPFRSVTASEIDPQALVETFDLPFVQKAQRGGYDGRGVQIIRSEQDLSSLWPTPSVFEPFLANVRELAVLVARGRSGELQSYSPVSLSFNAEHNILETVSAPADVSAAIADEAIQIAERAITKLDSCGLSAVEFFLTEDDTLLINEISPRVHNAGHHTVEACETSQFEQHLRAVAGLPLGSVRQPLPAVMRNLLYTPDLKGLCGRPPGRLTDTPDNVFVHWYGKHEARPYRKMGHITCIAPTLDEASRLADQTQAQLARLHPNAAA